MWHIRDKQTCCRWLRPNIVWTCNDKCNKHNDHRRIGIISIVDFFFLVCIPGCVRLQCIWYSLLQSYFFLFLSGCDWQFYLLICNLTNCNCVLCAENWAIVICQLRWQQAYVCVCVCVSGARMCHSNAVGERNRCESSLSSFPLVFWSIHRRQFCHFRTQSLRSGCMPGHIHSTFCTRSIHLTQII